jgi:transposase
LIALAAQHPEWALGFEDEVWWSRVTQPHLHSWSEGNDPVRLVEQTTARNDTDPKALACYGLLVSCPAAEETLPEEVWLRFVEGKPLSDTTTQFLDWCCQQLEKRGKTTLVLIWDNASWHNSNQVRIWIETHNQQCNQQGKGVRIMPCFLPSKSPWLNRIEPFWVHGKRNIVEPARLLTADEVAERVCAYFGCPHEPHLTKTEDVP